jgi:glycosyltransferase involved in cell wall biosynthesis
MLVLTLRDLGTQDYPADAWELVVLDDGSRDGSTQISLMAIPDDIRITVKRWPVGGTYSHATLFNELLRLANPDSDVFVHVEDVRLRTDFLLQHAKWHRREQMFLVTGPMCEGYEETFEPTACSRWTLMRMSGVLSQAYQCCFQAVFAKSMSYSRALLKALKDSGDPNFFDSSMSGWGYHETEFALRAERAGAICVYDTACAVYHPIHRTRDELKYRGVRRAQAQSEGTARNVEYLCRKHGLVQLPEWRTGRPIEPPPISG